MQPENSRQVGPSAEQLPMPPEMNPEAMPSLPRLDTSLERGQERFEQAAEAGARASDAAASATAAATVAAPVVPTQVPQSQPAMSATPLVAADEDLIEKEWVDKAKQIIESTRDDPHARTQRVNELQRDYLQKRYGKIVGANE